MSDAPKRQKASYVGMPAHADLHLACVPVWEAFGNCYLVGSCVLTPDFRDVDVRVLLPAKRIEEIFGETRGLTLNPLWNVMCTSISHYLSERSGLPVDFQIQVQEIANEKFKEIREPIGLLVNPKRKIRAGGAVNRHTGAEAAGHQQGDEL